MYVNYALYSSPWYNRTGWLGVKHQVTYLLCLVLKVVFFNLSVFYQGLDVRRVWLNLNYYPDFRVRVLSLSLSRSHPPPLSLFLPLSLPLSLCLSVSVSLSLFFPVLSPLLHLSPSSLHSLCLSVSVSLSLSVSLCLCVSLCLSLCLSPPSPFCSPLLPTTMKQVLGIDLKTMTLCVKSSMALSACRHICQWVSLSQPWTQLLS